MQKYCLMKPGMVGFLALLLQLLLTTSGCTSTDGAGSEKQVIVAVTTTPPGRDGAGDRRELGGRDRGDAPRIRSPYVTNQDLRLWQRHQALIYT